MMGVVNKIGWGVAGVLLALGLLTPLACRSAEPFTLGDDGGFGLGGSGGFGTLPVTTGGGGSVAAGGASGAGGDGSGGASVDAQPEALPVHDAGSGRPPDTNPPPTVTPDGPLTAINCYLYAAYKPGTAYTDGARVFQLRDLRVFQCKPWPYSGWCSQDAYEPDGPTGYWPDAWTPIGYCE
ncbi:MAG TPA: hypothetical protein VGL59_11645 [Polyangia bacterium]|jgi:hypothetical protein